MLAPQTFDNRCAYGRLKLELLIHMYLCRQKWQFGSQHDSSSDCFLSVIDNYLGSRRLAVRAL